MEQFKGSMDALKNNKEPEKRDITPINAKVRVKKPSKLKTAWKIIFSKDIGSAIKDAIADIAIPNLKDNMAKTGKNVIDQMFYDNPPKNGGYRSIYDNVSYNSMSQRAINTTSSSASRTQRRSIYDVNHIVFDDITQVKDTIAQLQDICRRYDCARVLDFYDIIGQPSNNYMDDRYGWYNLDNLTFERREGGYVILFPKVVPLDKNN